MGSFALINGAFAVAKLIAYLRHVGRAELSVPQICLTFEIIGNIRMYYISGVPRSIINSNYCCRDKVRLIYWVMDPVFLIRGVFSYLASQLFTSITNPIMITSTVLVAIYWAELLEKSSVKVTTKLRKFTIPFIIICIVTFFIVFIVRYEMLFNSRASRWDLSNLAIVLVAYKPTSTIRQSSPR
jgi:hypothetical protein